MHVSALVFAIWEMLVLLFRLSKLQLLYVPNGENKGPYVTRWLWGITGIMHVYCSGKHMIYIASCQKLSDIHITIIENITIIIVQ